MMLSEKVYPGNGKWDIRPDAYTRVAVSQLRTCATCATIPNEYAVTGGIP